MEISHLLPLLGLGNQLHLWNVTGKWWDLADPCQLRHVARGVSAVASPPGCSTWDQSHGLWLRSLHTLIFLDTEQKGVGMVHGIYVVRGSVGSSFSTLPSSELSTQGLLFIGCCGSAGNGGQKTVQVLEKRGSLSKIDFVRNRLNPPHTKPCHKTTKCP